MGAYDNTININLIFLAPHNPSKTLQQDCSQRNLLVTQHSINIHFTRNLDYRIIDH